MGLGGILVGDAEAHAVDGLTGRNSSGGMDLGQRWEVMGRQKVNRHGKVEKQDLEFSSKRMEAKILERRARVMELLARSWSYSQIAREVGVSAMQITRDVKEVTQEWRERYLQDMDSVKAKEVHRVEHILHSLWEEWDRSKWRVIQKLDKQGNPVGKERKVRVVADVEIMDRIVEVVKSLWKLYGLAQDVTLNATQNNLTIQHGQQQPANTAPHGSPQNPFPWDALYGKPQLDRIEEALEEVKGARQGSGPTVCPS